MPIDIIPQIRFAVISVTACDSNIVQDGKRQIGNYPMRTPEPENISNASSSYYSGVDSIVLDSSFVTNILGRDSFEAPPVSHRARTGIINGVLFGAGFWVIVYLALRLIGS